MHAHARSNPRHREWVLVSPHPDTPRWPGPLVANVEMPARVARLLECKDA